MSPLVGVDSGTAERIVESLRKGIPPTDYLRHFTVGRRREIQELESSLSAPRRKSGALLVQANYGAGKTHLLRHMRELALTSNYAVSLVTVDSQAGIRFNRMDQILGSVVRNLDLGLPALGIKALFTAIASTDVADLPTPLQRAVEAMSDEGRWISSDRLGSPGLWVALRAWMRGPESPCRPVAEAWLSFPPTYESKPGQLYDALVRPLTPAIRDPRTDRQMYRDGVFNFRVDRYAQAWSALQDLDLLVKVAGKAGLILLFDEFEDVIQNLNNIRLEQQAFGNLFTLFDGKAFGGMAYFAVTPDFAARCRQRLADRDVTGFPVRRFDELQRIEMRPITKSDFVRLADTIRTVHGLAYGWDARAGFGDDELSRLADKLFARPSADQVRQAVEGLVRELDDLVDD